MGGIEFVVRGPLELISLFVERITVTKIDINFTCKKNNKKNIETEKEIE